METENKSSNKISLNGIGNWLEKVGEQETPFTHSQMRKIVGAACLAGACLIYKSLQAQNPGLNFPIETAMHETPTPIETIVHETPVAVENIGKEVKIANQAFNTFAGFGLIEMFLNDSPPGYEKVAFSDGLKKLGNFLKSLDKN